MRNALILLSVLALCFTLFGEEKKYKVAVMEFDDQTKKLSKSVLEAAAEYLRGELVASNQFIVISKDRQKAVVKEKKKESWKECYDQSCRIQLGQALSADTILTGTISKFGNAYTLTLELVDLAKEATVKGSKAEFNGTESGLKTAIEGVSAQISGVADTQTKKPSNEEIACAFAKEKDDADVWQDYLKEYPKGTCAFEAKSKIKELKKREAEEKATQVALEKEEKLRKAAEKTEEKKSGKMDTGRWKAQNEIVTDTQTGLMWQRARADKVMVHKTAIEYCANLSLDGYNDWRLPSISELKTLIVGCQSGTDACKVSDDCLSTDCESDSSCSCKENQGPGEDGNYWQKGVWLGDDSWFWSSSVHPNHSVFAWYVQFNYGDVDFYNSRVSGHHSVRCVRGR